MTDAESASCFFKLNFEETAAGETLASKTQLKDNLK